MALNVLTTIHFDAVLEVQGSIGNTCHKWQYRFLNFAPFDRATVLPRCNRNCLLLVSARKLLFIFGYHHSRCIIIIIIFIIKCTYYCGKLKYSIKMYKIKTSYNVTSMQDVTTTILKLYSHVSSAIFRTYFQNFPTALLSEEYPVDSSMG